MFFPFVNLFADSYPRCFCECVFEFDPDRRNDYTFQNGVCDNRHISGACPYTCNVGYTGDCCRTSVGTF